MAFSTRFPVLERSRVDLQERGTTFLMQLLKLRVLFRLSRVAAILVLWHNLSCASEAPALAGSALCKPGSVLPTCLGLVLGRAVSVLDSSF